ncbi:MAG TPA: hypothetical protein VFQ35_17865, partial [Polyangiaceae bacterium]|nr:hypothetical protein [Polyangiaceae bacterium]
RRRYTRCSMFLRGLVPCCVSVWAIVGCSGGSSTSDTPTSPPQVFIDAIFTTQPDSTQGIARPPDRQPLGTVSLPCDGFFAVRLAYENWDPRAPGLCGEAKNCGHAALTLTLGEQTSETMVVASPALFTLTEQPIWAGTGTLQVELRDDFDSPHLVDGAPARDQIEVPLAPMDCSNP